MTAAGPDVVDHAKRKEQVMATRIMLVLMGLTMLAGAAHPSWAASPTTIKLAYEVAQSHPKGVWAADFKAKAEELSGGRIKVDI